MRCTERARVRETRFSIQYRILNTWFEYEQQAAAVQFIWARHNTYSSIGLLFPCAYHFVYTHDAIAMYVRFEILNRRKKKTNYTGICMYIAIGLSKNQTNSWVLFRHLVSKSIPNSSNWCVYVLSPVRFVSI